MSRLATAVPKPPKTVKARRPIRRNGKPKAVNAQRKAKNFQRAYGGVTRLTWIKAWTCMAWRRSVEDCAGAIDAVHIKSGGTGRKADAALTIPLCRLHHRELHQHGARTFEERHSFTLAAAAELCEAQWQLHVQASVRGSERSGPRSAGTSRPLTEN